MVAAVVRHTICCKIVLKTGLETGTHGGGRIIERLCQYMVAAVKQHTICCKNVLKTGPETDTHGGARIEKIYFSKKAPDPLGLLLPYAAWKADTGYRYN
jgi:hypothetical protein